MKQFIALVGILLFFFTYSALPTTINGRLIVSGTQGSKISLLFQINTNTGTDDLGGATFVFGFDTNAIKFTNTPIVNVDYIFHNFSSGNYSSGTLTRPMKNRIWVNIDLPFTNNNNGTIVAAGPQWTNVVTIKFDIVDINKPKGLSWFQSSPFWGIYDADNTTLWETGVFEGNFGLVVEVDDGWNSVSVPGINPDGQGVNIWWPGKDPSASVYKWLGGNIPITTTVPGQGYWMKHIGNKVYNTGDEWPVEGMQMVPHDPIIAEEGWNLIGGYENIVPISSLTTTPPGLITGIIYSYSDNYQIANNLEPGHGYFIKMTGAGQINLNSGFAKEDGSELEYFKNNSGKITFTDNSKQIYTLYFVNNDVDLDLYEMPPTPPEDAFDIRFSSGRIAECLDNGIQPIIMNGVNYPIKIKVENINIKVQDESGKIINADLNSGEEITITIESIKKLLIQSDEQTIPNEYFLSQNYPNPFNPSTKIKFAIPNDADVNLSIYNVLGELVTTLVDKNLNAGQYEYEFDAHNLSSGIYIYRIKANDFVETKKMVLLR